jgi:hypothetical protein
MRNWRSTSRRRRRPEYGAERIEDMFPTKTSNTVDFRQEVSAASTACKRACDEKTKAAFAEAARLSWAVVYKVPETLNNVKKEWIGVAQYWDGRAKNAAE